LIGVVAGQVKHPDCAAQDSDESDEGQDAQPGVDVGVAMKDLTHRVAARVRVLPKAYSKRGLLQKQTGILRRIAVCSDPPVPARP
jgi:hypothetical protein